MAEKKIAEEIAAEQETAHAEKKPPLGGKGGGAAPAAAGGSVRRTAVPEMPRKTVTLRLPRARAGEEDTVFVGVNGKAWRIRRGVTVEVPRSVAEVLRNGMSAEERAELYKATLS